jgi:putative transposase
MSRLRRIEQRERFFFVTTNVAKGVARLVPVERTLVLQMLGGCRARMGFRVFAFVVMADHVHLLMEPETHGLTGVMREFKSKSGLALNARRGTVGAIWQPRFFDFICRKVSDFTGKMEYIHRNPVTAGMVARPEEWTWSSAGFLMRGGETEFVPDFIDMPAEGSTPLWPAPWR